MPASSQHNNLQSSPVIRSVLLQAGLAPAVLVDKNQRQNAIQSGIPGTLLLATIAELDLPRSLFAQMLNVHADQITASGMVTKLSMPDGQALLDALTIFSDAEEIFDNWESARSWLSAPVPALGSSTPVAKMSDDMGRREMWHMIRRIQTGDFT